MDLRQFLPLIIIFGLMWLLIIRPQQIQQRKRQQMLARVKRGDEVVTIGGIHGKVEAVTDDIIKLQIADGVVVQMNKAGIGFIKGENDEGKA